MVLTHLYFSVKSRWTRIYRPLYCFDDPGAHGQFFLSSLLSADAPRTSLGRAQIPRHDVRSQAYPSS